jgi:hypothetical protein
MEYEAFDGSLSQVRKPSAETECVTEQGMAPMHAHVYQTRDSRLTIEQVENLIDRKLEKFKIEIKELIKKSQTPYSQFKSKTEITCTFCKGVGHTESRCYKKYPNLRPVVSKTEAVTLND